MSASIRRLIRLAAFFFGAGLGICHSVRSFGSSGAAIKADIPLGASERCMNV